MPDLNGRELLHEWRQLMEAVVASATSATARKDLPGEVASRLLAPLDAVFDLLEQAGATIRGQAEALEDAGRALEESAGLMKRQAELFERTIATLRQPTERAKSVAGAKPRTRTKAPRKPPA